MKCVCQMLVSSCFEGKTRPGYATETYRNYMLNCEPKKLAHFPPVSEHRITVLSQIVIMLVENYVDWMQRAEIYKKKKRQNVSCIYLCVKIHAR